MKSDESAVSQTTKRVRILVAIDSAGKWISAGYDYGNGSDPKDWIMVDDLNEHMAYCWIEADVPIPTEATVVGECNVER